MGFGVGNRRLRRVALGAAVLLVVLAGPVASAPGDPTVRFSAAGDFSAGASATSVLNLIGSLDNDFHAALGDMSYGTTGAEDAWCNLVKAGVGEGYPFELVSGNHESNGQNGNINDFSACLPNQLPGLKGTYGRQYYVDVPANAPLVRYVAVSSGIPFTTGTKSYASGTPEYAWTSAAIDGARAAGIPWVVVGNHTPCVSLGEYACEMGSDLANLLLAKKVDVVLTGHEHIYQRTKQLTTRTGCATLVPGTFNATCVVDSDNDLAAGAGTVFATVGTGGINQRNVNTTDPEAGYFAAYAGLNVNSTFGVLDFSLTSDVLTATFRRASGGTFSDAFTITKGVAPPNQPPTAAFTPTCTQLACSVDASASSDADGTIASYAWQFGDGTTGTGVNASRTYAAAGTYTITLTVTDDDGATDTTTRSVTVAPTPNQLPTASFTTSCTDLACSFNGTGSSDPDGTIASYAWQWGDGTADGTGATANHTYAAAGTYTARLTVTDNAGATGTTTKDVTVTAPPPVTVLAADAYGRTLATGWGSADTGGAWTTNASSSALSVTGGAGQVRLNAGSGPWLALAGVSSSSTDLVTTIFLDKVPTGSGAYVSLNGRRVPGVGDYRAKVHYTSNGGVWLSLQRATAANAETVLAAETQVPGITMAAGEKLLARVQVTGTSPTTVRARVWKAGTTEPTTWQKTATDSTSGFQAAGGVGFYLYLSGAATNAPIAFNFDDLKAVPGP
ncbi:PKD repeat-containing protein [Pedococcus dokdonensis]|uniref:PKD repeat-containing protein n=1 Tax=Pedococcus dokdonensis TaxID=443156 RepID=A0A1H0V8Q4_9MICO|nr:PKD domain-containing protein [Pedococcus dokdonensis]SDP74598.1 PKD repeat-containing protein [Pedococcus dokdonensis]